MLVPVYKRVIALVVFAIGIAIATGTAGLAAKQLQKFPKQEPAAKVVATRTLTH